MKDPYLYLDSEVLKNLAGIQDAEELKNMEADYTLFRLSEIAEDDSLEKFDFQTLCELHYRIFQDVYEWAGKPRVINIEKLRRCWEKSLLSIRTVLISQKMPKEF